jgi:hypothetical protein
LKSNLAMFADTIYNYIHIFGSLAVKFLKYFKHLCDFYVKTINKNINLNWFNIIFYPKKYTLKKFDAKIYGSVYDTISSRFEQDKMRLIKKNFGQDRIKKNLDLGTALKTNL